MYWNGLPGRTRDGRRHAAAGVALCRGRAVCGPARHLRAVVQPEHRADRRRGQLLWRRVGCSSRCWSTCRRARVRRCSLATRPTRRSRTPASRSPRSALAASRSSPSARSTRLARPWVKAPSPPGRPRLHSSGGSRMARRAASPSIQNPADPDRRLFTTYYLVLNNTDTEATVRGVFYLEDDNSERRHGGHHDRPGAVARHSSPRRPSRRCTIASSPRSSSRTCPWSMERAMYWGNGMRGAHASGGTVLPDTSPSLASPQPTAAADADRHQPEARQPRRRHARDHHRHGLGLLSWATANDDASASRRRPPANIIVNNANIIRS